MIEHLGVSANWTSRQRLRRMHMEWFSYNVYKNNAKLEEPSPVLFDYTEQKTHFRPIKL